VKALALRRRDGIELHTPYMASFVEALKYAVPSAYREWRSDDKVWVVEPPYIAAAIELAKRYFDVEVIAPHTPAECLRVVQAAWSDYATLNVLPGAAPEVVSAAFRALAKATHPDRAGPGGHQRMVRLNAAHDRLTDRTLEDLSF
jgi:hypothetical protein